MIARRIRVTGRVQGVFFRQSALEQAGMFGVAGWARNCPDGSVEVHAEGEERAVTALIDWLHRGPSAARVDQVEVRDADPEGAPDFAVRRG